MADTEKKISELDSAAQINTDDITVLSQGSAGTGFASVKATILAIANKIVSGINFSSALQTTDKTITGAINEIAQGGGGSGGHTILDNDGTALAQEDDLQFAGTYSEDDSTNGKTVVNITREMTQAEYDLLSADKKKGIIRITDDNFVCDGSEVKYSNGVSVNDKIDDLNNKVTSLFVKDSVEIPTFTVNAGTFADKTVTIPTKTGYIPVAVSEWMLRTATGTLTRATVNASNMELTITIGNPTQTAITPNPYFNILYIKNNT